MGYIMKEDLLKGISYERDANSSYLTLETESYQGLLEYQIEMINNNLNQGHLPIKSVLKDNKLKLFYETTSKESLKSYLRRTVLTKSQLIGILTDITKSILNSKELLIDDNGFFLNEELIFIDVYSFKIGLVYIPIRTKGNINEDFKQFILKILTTTVRMDESYRGLLVERILNYIKQDDFNLKDFLHELNTYEGDTIDVKSFQDVQETKSEESNSYVNNELVIKEENINSKTAEYTTKKIYKPFNVLIAAICQIIITVFLLIAQDSINNLNNDPMITYLGLGLIIVAFDILLFKKLFSKDSMIEKTITKGKSKRIKINFRREAVIPAVDYVAASSDTAILIPESSNPTQELETNTQGKGKAFLKDINDGRITNTQAVITPFTIGRHIENVNYIINNKAVGRTHAEIILKAEKYYLKDLNSKNGTKINGMKLEANKEYELKNEDIIIFADSKHIFIMNEKVNEIPQTEDVITREGDHEC